MVAQFLSASSNRYSLSPTATPWRSQLENCYHCFLKEARDQFKNAVHQTVAASSTLTLLVQLSPSEGPPKWLAGNTALPRRLIRTLSRALLSSHNLRVETSRWHKMFPRDRVKTTQCQPCDTGLENIEHMLCVSQCLQPF